jgi:hypothetical protein
MMMLNNRRLMRAAVVVRRGMGDGEESASLQPLESREESERLGTIESHDRLLGK